jgi:hypothetical protein
MVECWGSSLTSPGYVIVGGPADWATKHKLLQAVAEDEDWRDEQVHRESVSWRAALQARLVDQETELQRAQWEQAQREKIRQVAALREQAERELTEKDRLRPAEPYRVANLQPMQYAQESPDILGNVNRILENASQYTRAYEQRVREQSQMRSQTAADPAPSLYPSPNPSDQWQQNLQRQEQRLQQQRQEQNDRWKLLPIWQQ